MSQWIVYMVRCADKSLYTGITTNLSARVEKHNNGTGAKYTRGRGPVVCVWMKCVRTEGAARKQEAKVKRLSKREKEQLVEAQGSLR